MTRNWLKAVVLSCFLIGLPTTIYADPVGGGGAVSYSGGGGGGAPVANPTFTGTATAPIFATNADNSAAAPSVTFNGAHGFYHIAGDNICYSSSGHCDVLMGDPVMTMGATGTFGWDSTTNDASATSQDTNLSRDAPGVVDVGTGAQGSKAGTVNATTANFTGVDTNGTTNSTTVQVGGKLLCSSAAPTVTAGGGLGTPGTITGNACAFDVTAGTGAASTFTINLPTATAGWVCNGSDITTNSTSVFVLKQQGGTTATAVMGMFSDVAVLAAVGTADHLRISCSAF